MGEAMETDSHKSMRVRSFCNLISFGTPFNICLIKIIKVSVVPIIITCIL